MAFQRPFVLLGFFLVLAVSPAAGQDEVPRHDPLLTPGWQRIGGFSGSSGTRLLGRVNDLLFEQEASGSLYRDLGDVTLGLGLPLDDAEVRWENSFFRRVLPMHRSIEPSGVVTGDDLSGYLDIKTLISRGRLGYDVVTDIIDDAGVIGVQGEGGVSLTLGRIHPPLELGDRPLAEVLDDTDRDLDVLTRDWPKGQDRSLLRLGTEGAAAMVRWIANSIGRKTIDTERADIFYEDYDETVTLFIDLGLPVEAEPFTEGDTRLGPGDFVRQVTFLGLSPIAAGIEIYGLEASYRRFYRFLRETTIVKESGGTVLVQIRTAMMKGDETTPLKVRPEIRILGILTLGYTFFEQVYTGGPRTSYETAYRIDLNDPRGMECFRAILGDGTRGQLRPLAEAAVERQGAVRLAAETRRGINRTTQRRFRCFSLFNLRDWRIATSDLIETDDESLRETVLGRNWSHRKRFGQRHDHSKRLLVRSLADISDMTGFRSASPETNDAAAKIDTGLRDSYATGEGVRRFAGMLRKTLDWDDHPVLDELAQVEPDVKTRFALNLRLSFGGDHVERIAEASEDAVWTELAGLLLGDAHHDLWSTPEQRRAWRKGARRARRARKSWFEHDPLGLRDRPMSAEARYRLARRSVKKFAKLQREAREGQCLSCLADSFGTWDFATMMQILMARIGSFEGSEVGYHYEVFIDEMLRPVTVSNESGLKMPYRGEIGDLLKRAMGVRTAGEYRTDESESALTDEYRGWQGDRFLEPSLSRLDGGDLLLNVGVEAVDETSQPPCWMLRLYSDVRYAEDLNLRIDLREFRGIGADTPMGHARFAMGEPTGVETTPFLTARYSYDIPLPADDRMVPGNTYSLLLRVLNAEGLTVSEEQQAKLVWPEGGLETAVEGCYLPPYSKQP
jgi:hypothetical protein